MPRKKHGGKPMAEMDQGELTRTNQLLKEKLLRWMPDPGQYPTRIGGLQMIRREQANQSGTCFGTPTVGLIVQGSKRTRLGSETYVYGENQCCVSGVDMPSSFCAIDATAEHPFLSLALELDKYLIIRLAAGMPPCTQPDSAASKGVSIVNADPEALNAFLRLVELLDAPDRIPVLAPLIIHEIHYRLLLGPYGESLRKLNTLGTQSNQIAKAISWLRSNYKDPLRVDELAQRVNMATSTFHRHFKEMTSLSPLQYHKQLRLHEAQRLMLTENQDAASACLAVGYESPTQFNREYKRLFGEPPHRDIMRLR